MGAGQWFWIVYVICVLFGAWGHYPFQTNYRPFLSYIVLFVLIGLLGWHDFGPPLR
jgi:hypothetical protein